MPRRRRIQFNRQESLRYVIYARMSSHEQNPRSPEQQIDAIHEECRRERLTWIEVAVYIDRGITGRLTRRRPQLMKLLDDVRSGRLQVDVIVVDTPARLGRNDDDVPELRRQFARYGVVIVDALSHFRDPTTTEGKLLSHLDDSRSAQDNEVKGHDVSRGKRDVVKRKLWPGGRPPVGYRIESFGVEKRGTCEVILKRIVPDAATRIFPAKCFLLAYERGWSGLQCAAACNVDPEIPDCVKPVYANTVDRILSNPIYIGRMEYGKVSVDYENDVRCIEQQPVDGWVIVNDFCEPLVDTEVYESVQHLKRERSEKWHAHRSPVETPQFETGVAIRYPLSGLVRCGECGRAMVASGRRKRAGKVYYYCAHVAQRLCENGRFVREDWLRATVMKLIVSRMFAQGEIEPVTAESVAASSAFVEFCELVEAGLCRAEEALPLALQSLQAERDELRRQQDGIARSLANPQLDDGLRRRLEEDYAEHDRRMREVDALIQGAANVRSTVASVCDPARVAEELTRLADTLNSDNAPAANLELARVIDSITCDASGAVTIKMCKLAFLLPGSWFEDHGDQVCEETAVNRRRLPSRAVPTEIVDELSGEFRRDTSIDQSRFARLGDEWFWIDILEIPINQSWVQENAIEVAQSRLDNPCSKDALAERFGVSRSTIQKALRLAKQQGVDATKIDGRTLHGNWARDHAQEVAAFMAQHGRNILRAAQHFQKSTPWIREALKYATEAAENAPHSGNDATAA